MNTINILTVADRKSATKTFKTLNDGRIQLIDYAAGTLFTRQPVEINGLRELYELLVLLEPNPQAFIIRGEILPEFANTTHVTRTIYDIPEENQVACFKEYDEGLNWIMLDFDKINLPADTSPQAGVELLVAELPTEFQDASYCYQFSSSAGVAGDGFVIRTGKQNGRWIKTIENLHFLGWAKVSVHIFFWLTTKISNSDINEWAVNLNLTRGKVIDPAPLRPVQPNYTAKPQFINMDDPLPENRSGLVIKTKNAVDLVKIPTPDRFVVIDGKTERVGDRIVRNGQLFVVSETFQDRLNHVGLGSMYREPLKKAIATGIVTALTAATSAAVLPIS